MVERGRDRGDHGEAGDERQGEPTTRTTHRAQELAGRLLHHRVPAEEAVDRPVRRGQRGAVDAVAGEAGTSGRQRGGELRLVRTLADQRGPARGDDDAVGIADVRDTGAVELGVEHLVGDLQLRAAGVGEADEEPDPGRRVDAGAGGDEDVTADAEDG